MCLAPKTNKLPLPWADAEEAQSWWDSNCARCLRATADAGDAQCDALPSVTRLLETDEWDAMDKLVVLSLGSTLGTMDADCRQFVPLLRRAS